MREVAGIWTWPPAYLSVSLMLLWSLPSLLSLSSVPQQAAGPFHSVRPCPAHEGTLPTVVGEVSPFIGRYEYRGWVSSPNLF